jgi:hypothetical protein
MFPLLFAHASNYFVSLGGLSPQGAVSMSYLSCYEILEHTKEHGIIDLMSCLFCTFFVL